MCVFGLMVCVLLIKIRLVDVLLRVVSVAVCVVVVLAVLCCCCRDPHGYVPVLSARSENHPDVDGIKFSVSVLCSSSFVLLLTLF